MEMATILDRLAAYAAQRTAEKKKTVSLEEIREKAIARYKEQAAGTAFSFERALSGGGMHFICECKKASPSKGLIAPDFPYMEIARSYEAAGASAISVLTEPGWFLGEDRFLREISEAVSIPCLRKDFTVDSYMIYEAKLLGASAVLLICAILDDVRLAEYLETAHSLGLSALVEAHDETEVRRALAAGARIIGVNNRDLHTFEVDINNSVRLRSLVPADCIYVSESGIRNAGDVGVLYQNGTNAVLIGETLMRSPDKGAQLRELRSRCKKTLEKRLTEPCVRSV
jgi:indole-3-glycerol phosphate synthase